MSVKLSQDQVQYILDCLSQGEKKQTEIAQELGIHPSTISKLKKRVAYERQNEFEIPDMPDEDRDVDELLDHLCNQWDRVNKARNARKLIDVDIKIDGPIGLVFFGDPHIDNRGFNAPYLIKCVDFVASTEGMYGVNVGDLRDNWVGRLAYKYNDQEVTGGETRRLIKWLFESVPWLCLVLGNHDHWHTEGGNPIKEMWELTGRRGILADHDARLRLKFPNGNIATVRTRHDFKGNSIYNETHGHKRATLWEFRDDILACGDRHHSGYSHAWYNEGGHGLQEYSPILCHLLRIGTFKHHDSYAEKGQFKPQNYAPVMVAVIDPDAAEPVDKVKVEFSIESGVERLKMARAKWKLLKNVA